MGTFARSMIVVVAAGFWSGPAFAGPSTMVLDVDATRAPMKILHATLEIPVRPGPITLFYPKWIPGEHMPSGPIPNLVGLHVYASDKEVDWRRDLVEMNAFHVVTPPGARALKVELDYVVPISGTTYGTAPSADAKCAVVNWYTLLLYPLDQDPDSISVRASLKLPRGWTQAGSLDVSNVEGDLVHYVPTSLTMLNDSPVVMGEHMRSVSLWPKGSDVGEHVIDAVADSDWALEFPEARIDGYRRLIREERRVFGDVGHYRKYHFLLALADSIHGGGEYGVEHHECSDNRLQENGIVDDTVAKRTSDLLPHEFFHSWNGKTRRPFGLATGGYDKPMQDDLLWVYEGLTQYYGELLPARAGLITLHDWTEALAADVLKVGRPGRTWRPLQDTADAAPFLYVASNGWEGWRRDVDFYAEGSLIWLEADVTIRRLTGGEKSLDDFCALFLGQKDSGRTYVKPYGAAEVYALLQEVAHFDWKGFFEARLQAKGTEVPLGGVKGAGYALTYTDFPNLFTDPVVPDNGLNATASLGIHVTADGTVDDAFPQGPAFEAGVSNGMKIVAVDARRFSVEELKRALARSPNREGPLQLLVENSGYFKTVSIDYHGGLRYPHLEPLAGAGDLLSKIASPRVREQETR